MPAMKSILERWDSYLIFEEDALSQLKIDPIAVEDLASDIVTIKDRKKLQALLSALSRDPQVMQVVNTLKSLSADAAQEADSLEASDSGVDEGISDELLNLSTHAYVGIRNLMSKPAAQKIMKIAPPLLGLGLIAYKLSIGGGLDPDDNNTLSTIIKATGKTDLDSIVGMLGATTDGAITENRWNC